MSRSTPEDDTTGEAAADAAEGTAPTEGADPTGETDDGVDVDRYLTVSLLVLLVGAVVSVTGVGGPSLSGPLFVPDWKFGALAAVVMAAGIARAELAG
jgi:hypothetical protein